MPKSRSQKAEILNRYTDHLQNAKATVFFNYQGMKVNELRKLRKTLKNEGIDFHITKNTLLKLAFKKNNIEADEQMLDQPLAAAFGYADQVAPAKAVYDFSREIEALKILGGMIDHEFIDAGRIKQLATLPSREELYAKLVGSLAAPMSRMVYVLKGNLGGLVSILKQYQEKIS